MKNSSIQDSGDQNAEIQVNLPTAEDKPKRALYFINEIVEDLLRQYIWTGCTSVPLRDAIMHNASELVRQIIRKQGLHTIYPGQDESSFGDLLQVAWCVPEDTLLFTNNGIREIREIITDHAIGKCKSISVWGKDGCFQPTNFIRRPKSATRIIESRFNYKFEATLDHPIYVLTNVGPIWKKCGELKCGDLVAIQYNQQTFGKDDQIVFKPTTTGGTTKLWDPPKSWTPDLAYIVGSFIAEGSISNHRITIYNKDIAVIKQLQNNDCGLDFKFTKKRISNVVNSIRFVEFMRSLGFPENTNCANKKIPLQLLKCSKPIVCALLKGMFDGDGHSNSSNGTVGYTSTSSKLIDQLRIVLLNFGIVTKTTSVDRGWVRNPKGGWSKVQRSYQLLLSSENSKRFYDQINFGIKYKQINVKCLTKKPFALVDPITTSVLHDNLRTGKFTKADFSRLGPARHLLLKKKQHTINVFCKLVSGLKLDKIEFLADRLKEYSNDAEKLIWLPVTKISESENSTVDIEVPNGNSFTINGIIGSNCQLERTLYKFRARPHCRMCYNPDRPNDSALYNPSDTEYGIITFEDLVKQGIKQCKKCKTIFTPEPIIQAAQDTYGGSTTVLFRGLSKVFNMWCVTPDTLIFTDQGIMCIDDIGSDSIGKCQLDVFGPDGLNAAINYVKRKIAKTIKVITKFGYNLEATKDHYLPVLRQNGVEKVKVANLKIGDLLGIQYNQQCFGNDNAIDFVASKNYKKHWAPPTKWTEELAYIVGLVVSEGSISRDYVSICNTDKEIERLLCHNKLGLQFIRVAPACIENRHKQLTEFIAWLGLARGVRAWTKFIPDRILKCSRNILVAFLRGLFDGDGHSNKLNGTVGYTSTSKRLLNQLRVVLLDFGIMSRVSVDNRTERTFPGGHVSQLHGANQLLFSATDSKIFYDEIGFNIKYKQDKRKKLTLHPYRFTDVITTKYLQKLLRPEHYKPLLKIGCYKHLVLRKKQFSIPTFEKIIRHLGLSDKFLDERFNDYCGTSYKTMWIPITSLSDGESRTVDIERPSNGLFTANGFWSSNSQISRTVILAHIKKEGRDRKNANSYRNYVDNKQKPVEIYVPGSSKSAIKDRREISPALLRFLIEARELSKYNKDYLTILDALEHLLQVDDKVSEGLIGKLVEHSGLSRIIVTQFMRTIRLRSFEFTDSPINKNVESGRVNRKAHGAGEFEEE